MLWKGPIEDGITNSLLQKFMTCRERFRLRMIEGLVEDQGFKPEIEYGSMWHECEKALSRKDSNPFSWKKELRIYCGELRQQYMGEDDKINYWQKLCTMHFPLYQQYWSEHPDVINKTPILQEENFAHIIKLHSGAKIKLRGKYDAVDQIDGGVWVQENKSKGDNTLSGIDIEKTVHKMSQNIIYQTAARIQFKNVKGVRYNVILRPTSSRQGPRRKAQETEDQFIERIKEHVLENPSLYYHRYKVPISISSFNTSLTRILYPQLEQLLEWWDWVKDGKDPWRKGNKVHWEFPFGVYNTMATGYGGDYYQYFSTGSKATLVPITNLFPEL